TVITGNTVVWTKASVSGGEYGYLYLTARLDETLREGDVLTNTAYIATSHLETDYGDNVYTDTQTVVAGTRDMYVYKSRYSGVVRPGKDIQYRIYYQNQGNSSAADVIITDTLPISTTYVSDGNSAGFTTVITGSTVVWTKPSVPSGESDYLYLTVRISDTVTTGESLTNTVTISTSDEETDYSDNIYTDTQTVVPPSVDLYVRKSLSSGSTTPGSDVTYEIYYRNYGDDPAEAAVITDSLPSLMRYISHSGAFTPTVLGNQVIWDLGMVPGEPDDGYYGYLYLTAHISDTTPVGTILTNTVEISTSTTETGTYSNSDSDVRTVIAPSPNLKLWKTGWANLPRGLEAEILSNVVDWSFTGGVYQLGRVEQNIL
nr:DUF11 domain-containing protein [Chloroflexota bacterium]